MKIHTVISSVALAAALSFSGAAFAQNMLNGQEIPADKIEAFKGQCEALRAAGTASLTTNNDQSDDTAVDATATGSVADPAASTADTSDPAAQDNWDEAMASLTIEQCDAAGFPAE
jgi:hypothetical protein